MLFPTSNISCSMFEGRGAIRGQGHRGGLLLMASLVSRVQAFGPSLR